MNIFLTLPPAVERQYWAAPSTQHQLRQADTLGLTMGILTNLWMIASFPNRLARLLQALTISTQLAQLLWLRLRPASYAHARFYINCAQRTRVVLGLALGFARKPTDEGYSRLARLLTSPAGTRRAFFLILLSWPSVSLLASLNHSLPFKSHLFFTAALCFMHTAVGMPHQVHALHRYRLEAWAQSTCWPFETVFSGPSVMQPRLLGDICLGSHAPSLVTGSVYGVLAFLGPLHLVYWLEWLSKAGFLKGRRVPQAPEPRLPWPLILASLYLCCVLLWNGLVLLHLLLAARPWLLPFPGWS